MANGMYRKVKKSITKKKKSSGGGRRSTADQVQAQGTGKAVAKAFGGGVAKHFISKLPSGCWDAFNSCHAALPRAVGAYTVVRTTKLINTSSRLALVCTFARETGNTSEGRKLWSNVCALTEEGSGVIGTANSTSFHGMEPPIEAATNEYAGGGTLCPAAISVQVLGTSALATAHGQLAAAVCPVRLDIKGTSRTWDDIENTFLSYMRPRLMSAGKIVLRGVQMDSHPLSMNDVSDFRKLFLMPGSTAATGTAPGPWSVANGNLDPEGWSPMVIYNPENTPLSLLVTIEWRVRFDISNPAVSSHSHHGVTSDVAWEKHIAAANRQLPGVIDIVEKVASTGASIMTMMRAMPPA
jgi:hypothetical protein